LGSMKLDVKCDETLKWGDLMGGVPSY
jgi:hypothetical protein